MRSAQLVLNIPHSSTYIPVAVRHHLVLSDSALREELLRMTDAYTDELFDSGDSGAQVVRYPVSRLVADPERFEDDAQESMSRVGMGVIYTKTSRLEPLRNVPTPEERQELLDEYYRRHHDGLTECVEASLRAHGRCLVIDCHSFPSKALQYEKDQNANRPDICIGTDEFHTPHDLVGKIVAQFGDEGYSVELNRPFSGALVPLRFYRRDAKVSSVMIEVNRRLYMDENTGLKTDGFETMRSMLARVLGSLV